MRTFVCMCIATFVLAVTAAAQVPPTSQPHQDDSGGTTYLPEMESESELAYICSQIAFELRQQYTLAFYSNATGNDEWHKLKVRVRKSPVHSNLKLSYRKGYQFSRDQ